MNRKLCKIGAHFNKVFAVAGGAVGQGNIAQVGKIGGAVILPFAKLIDKPFCSLRGRGGNSGDLVPVILQRRHDHVIPRSGQPHHVVLQRMSGKTAHGHTAYGHGFQQSLLLVLGQIGQFHGRT